MATQADIPLDLTGDDSAYIFQFLDTQLNGGMLYALLHGILAVTLWNIFINKCWPIRRALVVVVILLYVLITVSFSVGWSSMHSAFIGNGLSFRTVYQKLIGMRAFYWETGITAAVSTSFTDLYIIWCCWMVWGRRWLIILFPIFFLVSAMVSKIIVIHHEYVNGSADVFPVLYASFILATTLWCTSLIIYRILTVTRARHGAEGRSSEFYSFVEVLVESSALYSVSLILFLAFAIRDDLRMHYFDIVAGIVKGVAPTLLIGRAAAGHTRPKDDCEESAVSTLRFQTLSELCMTNFQESTIQSVVLELSDIEAQSGRLGVFVERP
ncbi:hypothetical protein EDD85DRAFT_1005752 [Armillaria nabsnona]|nr:hypothetical protein EDD85DRAFT_1005752 [Armillaria nabsnona]